MGSSESIRRVVLLRCVAVSRETYGHDFTRSPYPYPLEVI